MTTYRLKAEDRKQNATYWLRREINFQEDTQRLEFHDVTADNIELLRQNFHSYQSIANRYIDEALTVFVLGHEEEALRLAKIADAAAQQALEQEDFSRVFTLEAREDPQFVTIEKYQGEMWSNRYLHYANWFLTGERDWRTYHAGAEAGLRAISIDCRFTSTDYIIEMCVEACKFNDAIGLIRSSSAKQYQGLITIAEWQLGDDKKEELAREKIEYWYFQSRKWHLNRCDLPWWIRLTWAWLHGRYISSVTELQPLLEGLKATD